MRSRVREDCCKEIVIHAGSSETEVKEFTVIPCRTPSNEAVTIVTPAVQARMAVRNWSGSMVILEGISEADFTTRLGFIEYQHRKLSGLSGINGYGWNGRCRIHPPGGVILHLAGSRIPEDGDISFFAIMHAGFSPNRGSPRGTL